MNQELNKELTILQEELGKIKSVSEILNNSKKSVADMAELSEKALYSFLELSPKLNSLIENEVQELTRVKEGFDDGVSDLKNSLLEEITNHRELVNSLLNTQITANSQSISKLSSEVIIASSQGIEEMKNFSALHHHETEYLQKEIIREFQYISKVQAEQVEKWQNSYINKIDELNELLSVEIGNKHSLIIRALELNNKNQIDLNIKQEKQIHSIKIVIFGILGLAIIILIKLFF